MAAPTDLSRIGQTGIQGAAQMLGVSRELVRKVIAENNIQPSGEDPQGNPLYRVVDIVRAVDARGTKGAKKADGEVTDPTKLSGTERDRWYASENKRLDLELRLGRLCDRDDVERQFVGLCIRFARFLDTLPDELERDAAMTAEQVEAMHESVRRQRSALHDEIERAAAAGGLTAEQLLAKIG